MAKRKKKKVVYSFSTVVKCPRCGSIDTVAYSTQGKIQYRRCRRAHCRHRFSIRGVAIESTKSSRAITSSSSLRSSAGGDES